MQRVPDYFDVIKEPVDLKMLAARIKDKYYSSKEAFVRDLYLMCENCLKYNDETTVFYQNALELQDYIRSRTLIIWCPYIFNFYRYAVCNIFIGLF